jgi:hypothetical protein
MIVRKPVKIFIGILTVFVVLYPFFIGPGLAMVFLLVPGSQFFYPQATLDPQQLFRTMLPMMLIIYPLMMCFSLSQLGLQIFYAIHEIKNKALVDTYRILFIIGTFLLPFVAMPIYFFVYLWKDNQQEPESPTPAPAPSVG